MLAPIMAPASAHAQDRGPAGGGSGGGTAAARLEVRQSELEAELRTLTGRVEDLSYRIQQLNQRLDKLGADVDYRLGQAGPAAPLDGSGSTSSSGGANGGTGGGSGMQGPPPAGGAPAGGPPGRGPRSLGTLSADDLLRPPGPAVGPGAGSAAGGAAAASGGLPAGTAREQYASAYDLLRQGRYDQAEDAFTAFLKQHPDDPLSENARYWLGESFYARGDYAQATETFVEGYQKSKTGPKAPDTLLKLGMSLAGMNKNKEACATFRELNKAFPNAAPAIKEKAAQESRRAGCS